MRAVCWSVIEPNIGKRSGSTVWKFAVTLTRTWESGTHGLGLHETVADQLIGGWPAGPSRAVNLAVAFDCTEPGADTTPTRTASRAAVVSRFRVNQARLSSTLTNSTNSRIGRIRTNSRLATPPRSRGRLWLVLLCRGRAGASRS